MEWLNRSWMKGLHPQGPKPFKASGDPTKLLKIALQFVQGNRPKSRKEILLAIGESPDRAETQGQLSCLFSTLTTNNVIDYDKKNRSYKAGYRFKEYMAFTSDYMRKKGYHSGNRKIYHKILREHSNTLDFIFS